MLNQIQYEFLDMLELVTRNDKPQYIPLIFDDDMF